MVTAFDVSSNRPAPMDDVTAAFGTGLSRLLCRALPRGRAALRARAQELHVEALAAPIHVHGDPDELADAITGLMQFASRQGPAGARIALSVAQIGEQARLRLSISGAATPPAGGARAARVRSASWHALKRAVGAHGVHLSRRSDLPDDGVEYEMVFRAIPVVGMASPLPHDLGCAAADAPVRRVLVVDDSLDCADSVACLLALHGHDVQVAYDGASALAKCANWRPHVVVLDIGLPDMSGLDVAQALKQCDASRDIILIALSGYGVDDASAPFDACLGKPVDPIVLLHTVDTLVGPRATRSEVVLTDAPTA